jgi:hypothetical protein
MSEHAKADEQQRRPIDVLQIDRNGVYAGPSATGISKRSSRTRRACPIDIGRARTQNTRRSTA